MSNLKNNTASLEALLEQANALPEEKKIQANKTITPTKSAQTAQPDNGYDGLAQVTVEAIPAAYQDVTGVTATAANVLTGSKFVDKNGTLTTGTMANRGAVSKTLNTSTKSYTIQAGYHNGSGKVSITTETKSATPTKSTQTITPTSGKVLSQVTVNAIPSQYITTTDATAAANDIVTGETAYVNGTKVTGTNPYEKTTTDAQVAEIEGLIEELNAALDGKSVPGGGGTSVETCTGWIEDCQYVYYTGVENGTPVAKVSSGSNSSARHNITICRDTVAVCTSTQYTQPAQLSNAVTLGTPTSAFYMFKPTAHGFIVNFSLSGGASND